MTGPDATPDDIVSTAQEYLAWLDNEVDERRRKTVQEEIEEGQERYEWLVREHGEDHKLTKKAKMALESRREELHELQAAEERLGTAREEILRAVAAEFELTEPWLRTEVVEAVTHALCNCRESSYKLFGREIASVDDLVALGELERIELAAVVSLLAKDALGETESAREQYRRLEESRSFAAFAVLCDSGAGSVTPRQVSEETDADAETVERWFQHPLDSWERLIPFHRPTDGEYGLSTTGRYFCDRFYDGIGAGDEGRDEDGDEDGEGDGKGGRM